MTVQVSTKFKELILGTSSFASIFSQGRILIYSGTQPTTADYPVSGTLLAQITLEGQPWSANGSAGGLEWLLSGPWVGKPPSAVWKLEGEATGTASWFRVVGASTDTGGLSFSAPRIDGSVGTSGADFYLESTAIVPSTSLEIQQFSYTFPPLT